MRDADRPAAIFRHRTHSEIPSPVARHRGDATAVRIGMATRPVLNFGGGARVLFTPGHTDGGTAPRVAEHRVLITGNTAAEPTGVIIAGAFDLDRAETAASFCRLAERDVDITYVGHREPVVGEPSGRRRQVAAALAA